VAFLVAIKEAYVQIPMSIGFNKAWACYFNPIYFLPYKSKEALSSLLCNLQKLSVVGRQGRDGKLLSFLFRNLLL
jgi:hypothetical protein